MCMHPSAELTISIATMGIYRGSHHYLCFNKLFFFPHKTKYVYGHGQYTRVKDYFYFFLFCSRHFAWCGQYLLAQDSFFPFFENFSKCFVLFQGEKYTFFPKFSKIGLVAEKLMITILCFLNCYLLNHFSLE